MTLETQTKQFALLTETFRDGLAESAGGGAALAVYRDGHKVVDLWGGVADPVTGRDWVADTPTVVFSCTKGLMSLMVAQVVAAGLLDYDTPVARIWPAFGAAGKQDVTVGEALSHRAGLSALHARLTEADIRDWTGMTARLAEAAPLWPRGAGYAYHAITHGWLAGEILRSVTGDMPGARLAGYVSGPLQAEAWIGVPDEVATRVARSQAMPTMAAIWEGVADEDDAPNWPLRALTLGGALPDTLVTENGGFNDPETRRAEIPGAGGIATARGLARIWSATVAETDGIRLLDNATIAEATRVRSDGVPVFGGDGPFCAWGAGFQLDSPARRYLSDKSFGHDGAGGQVAFADPDSGIGFAFVTNHLLGPEDDRATRLIAALRECL